MKRPVSQACCGIVWSTAFCWWDEESREGKNFDSPVRMNAGLQTLEMRWLCAVALFWSLSVGTANLPSDWQYAQQFNVPAAGLVKLSLPSATLNAARPGLEDLRLYDD